MAFPHSKLHDYILLLSNFFDPLGEIRILSSPKARSILINGAVKKGERLVPPSALEVLMRVTFPAPTLRVKVGLIWNFCRIPESTLHLQELEG